MFLFPSIFLRSYPLLFRFFHLLNTMAFHLLRSIIKNYIIRPLHFPIHCLTSFFREMLVATSHARNASITSDMWAQGQRALDSGTPLKRLAATTAPPLGHSLPALVDVLLAARQRQT